MIAWRVCESAAGHTSYRVRPGRRSEMYHGPVRAVAVGEVPGVWNLAAGEQVDDCSLVAKRVAELSVAQSYDVFVADPHAANPAGLWKKAPGCWQTSGRQRPQQRRIGSRLVDERC
jgi:hypothetical protein